MSQQISQSLIFGSSKAKETGEVVAAPAVHAPSGGMHFMRQSLDPKPMALEERPTVAGAPDDSKIVMVLDASGSMNTVKADIVGSINGFLDAQKTITEDKPTFSLLQFGHVNHWRFVDVPLETIPAFEAHMYEVAGGTPLFDSIGAAIETFDRFNDVSLVIITDGADNTSSFFTRERIRDMIAQKKAEQNWDIIYLCADESGFAAGAAMGVTSNTNAPRHDFARNIRNEMSFAVQQQRQSNHMSRLQKLQIEK
jgi:Mg-chelatase subunit ChlD